VYVDFGAAQAVSALVLYDVDAARHADTEIAIY
jgi:hypothetical protein